MFSWWKLVARCVLKFTCSYWNLEWKKSHHACFQHGFLFLFFPFYVLCIPTKKTKQKNVDEQALRTRKECSVSITQQKHKMEEIQFCSKVWEKHLEESWWVRDRESDAEGGWERERQRLRERWFINLCLYGIFFHSLNFSQPAEMAYCSVAERLMATCCMVTNTEQTEMCSCFFCLVSGFPSVQQWCKSAFCMFVCM